MFEGDNLPVLRSLPSGTFRAITLDPPFNTGRKRRAEEVRGTRVSPPPADSGTGADPAVLTNTSSEPSSHPPTRSYEVCDLQGWRPTTRSMPRCATA